VAPRTAATIDVPQPLCLSLVITAATIDVPQPLRLSLVITAATKVAPLPLRLALVITAATPAPATTHTMAAAAAAAAVAEAGGDGRRVRQRRSSDDKLPPLLQVLGGNSATTAMVLACFRSNEASALRQLHPAVAAVVEAVPWADVDASVFDVSRWRAALPAAAAAKVCRLPVDGELACVSVALAGVQRLELHNLDTVAALARLPASLHSLVVRSNESIESTGATFARLSSLSSLTCYSSLIGPGDHLPLSLQELCINDHRTLSSAADFRHLCALQQLTITCKASSAIVARLPPSLVELNLYCEFPWSRTLSFAHLSRLRVLNTDNSNIDARALATLPPCVVELTLTSCTQTLAMASFGHLPELQYLDVSDCEVSDEMLLSLPPSLAVLCASDCWDFTADAVLPALPALTELDVSDTEVGDALIASLPANGCFAPAAGMLWGHRGEVAALAVLPDGRLASGDSNGEVRLWDLARGGTASVALTTTNGWAVRALAVLPGGRYLAVGEDAPEKRAGSVEIWDVSCAPCVRCAVVGFDAGVQALAVLRNRRIAVACNDCYIWVMAVDDGGRMGVKTGLPGHTARVKALAVLSDGSLASAGADGTVRVWDARRLVCHTVLGNHLHQVFTLAVLPDGCLASLSTDGTVRLWDVSVPACVRVIPGIALLASALAALTDGRLVSVPAWDDTVIQAWDTRPHQRAACVAIPTVLLARSCARHPSVVLPLPGGLLASSGAEDDTSVHLWHLPPPPPA